MLLKPKLIVVIQAGIDLLLMTLAFYGADIIRFGAHDCWSELFNHHPGDLFLFAVVLLFCFYVFDVYSIEKNRSRKQILANICISDAVAFVVIAMIFYVYPPVKIGRGVVAIMLVMFFFMQYAWHISYAYLITIAGMSENALIVGTNEMAKKLGGLLEKLSSQFPVRLVGYIECTEDIGHAQVSTDRIVGVVDDLLLTAQRMRTAKILVASPGRSIRTFDNDYTWSSLAGVSPQALRESGFSVDGDEAHRNLLQQLLVCKFHGIEIIDGQKYYEMITGKLLINRDNIVDDLIYSDGYKYFSFMTTLKRGADICLALCGLLLSMPLFPVIALLIKLSSPGPVFYSQVRVGQWGKEYTLYKFRTMHQNSEFDTGAVWAQADDPRLTPVGRFLRKWRTDELPQFYNVLTGTMSIVGPRPERPEFVGTFTNMIPAYRYRHVVKPGITGWAQVKYTYGASVEDAYEKLCYDLYYIKHSSPALDLLILLETFKVVLFGRGR